MPARHRAPEPSRSPLLIVFILIILAGLICGGILLWQKLSPAGPDAASSPPASSGAGNSQPPQQAQQTPAPAPTPTPEPTPAPTPTPAPIPDNGEDGYLSEGLYIWNNMAFELFYGYDESAEPYAQAISDFAAQLPGIQVYNMVVPNHCEFGLPQRLKDQQGCTSQRENTQYIYNNLTGAVPVDIYDALDQHKEEYLYFNTDTHWAALGAYYAYEKFCETADVKAAPLEDFTLASYDGFLGYLYQLTAEDCLAMNPDRLDVYEPGYPYTAALSYDSGETFSEQEGINSSDSSMGYSMFLRGDNPCLRVVNKTKLIGRKLAVVKESYGNVIGPFLAASFDETYIIDFRSFEGSLPEFCQAHGVTDVLFLNSTIAANTYARVEDLYTRFP